MLAAREHSAHELRGKLQRGELSGDDVETVLAELAAQGLQSDQRFAQAFVRSRRTRGQGPLRIEADLRQRGVESELIESSLDGAEDGVGDSSEEEQYADWEKLARAVRRKRFGDEIPRDINERARQARFLRSRGFTEAQTRAAFSAQDE
ncbi:MAG: recombination regulator RecX [Chromatiales bacterium]|nr:recombination regulator RecX [Chromatiales bacterium]